jgi:DNA-binding response OmpR family regulator
MKVLIIEDEKDIGGFLKSNLENAGFNVDLAETGEGGSFLATTGAYDLVLLDLNLPDKHGFEVCKEIRLAGREMPIMILTVETEITNKVQLLNAGADDYLTKPFSISEVLARMHALLRRPRKLNGDILSFADLTLDSQKQSVKRNNKEIYLTRKEFMLLEYLLRNQGRVISRGEIIDHVWDSEADLFSNTIETHILNLRKKIDKDKRQALIKTFSGRGYTIG